MLLATLVSFSAIADAIPGLTVKEGQIVRCLDEQTCAPVHMMGVNYHTAMWRNLYSTTTPDTSYEIAFDDLDALDIRIVRIPLMTMWPNQQDVFFKNPTEYWRRVDALLDYAASRNLELVVNYMWDHRLLGEMIPQAVAAGYITPDADFVPANNLDRNGNPTMAEYRSDLIRSNSGSMALMRKLTQEFVTRYKDHPAVAVWECANEINLSHHVNKTMARTRPGGPSWGMMLPPNLPLDPPLFTGVDDMSAATGRVYKEAWATEVRKYDQYRMLMSGDAVPRQSAWNNEYNLSWTQDTLAQHADILETFNPDPIDSYTIHMYPSTTPDTSTSHYWPNEPGLKLSKYVYHPQAPTQLAAIVGQYKKFADEAGKPLVVGEFGVQLDGTSEAERLAWNGMVRGMLDDGVQIAMVWTWDSRGTSESPAWRLITGSQPGTTRSLKMKFVDTCGDPNIVSLTAANSLVNGTPCN